MAAFNAEPKIFDSLLWGVSPVGNVTPGGPGAPGNDSIQSDVGGSLQPYFLIMMHLFDCQKQKHKTTKLRSLIFHLTAKHFYNSLTIMYFITIDLFSRLVVGNTPHPWALALVVPPCDNAGRQ